MTTIPPPAPPRAADKTAEHENKAPCINSSPEIDKLMGALAKAQGEFETVKKDATNPFYHSNYATLSAVVEMVRKPLEKNGLVFMQSIVGQRMNTIVAHASGQFIISSIPFVLNSNDPQKTGSAITYAKRYGLQAALGVVVADEDDDGNLACGKVSSAQTERK